MSEQLWVRCGHALYRKEITGAETVSCLECLPSFLHYVFVDGMKESWPVVRTLAWRDPEYVRVLAFERNLVSSRQFCSSQGGPYAPEIGRS
jgi:hypothetical protein